MTQRVMSPRRLVSISLAAAMSPLWLVAQPVGVSAAQTVCAASTFAMSQIGGAIVNGQLFTWGRNLEGELGQGPSAPSLEGTPTLVSSSTGLSNVTGFWPGPQDTFATDGSGHVWSWGGFDSVNERGSSGSSLPAPVVGPTNVVSIGPGSSSTIALTAGHTMWGWGEPNELGLPGSFPVNPTVLPGPPNVVKVAAGNAYTLALGQDGTLWGAGSNHDGGLGQGSAFLISGFTPIPNLTGILDMAAGDGVVSFTVAVDGSGHVFAFGNNLFGEMGNGSASSTPQTTAAQVPGIDSVVQVAAGQVHVLVLKSDHTVWAWGANESGELGDGTTTNSPIPVRVQFPTGVQIARIAAGFSNSIALDTQGHLWAWGYNGFGAVGNGFILGAPVLTPTQLSLGPLPIPCQQSGPPAYLPTVNGYAFQNDGSQSTPTYDQMASYYPRSRAEIYFPLTSIPTGTGELFYHTLFLNFYSDGVCYGMAASDQFLYNEFPSATIVDDFPRFSSPFPDGLGASPSPQDTKIEQFIERYHSRQLAASGALEAGIIWSQTEDAGGNAPALNTIAAVTDSGKTEWIGLGPSRALLSQGPKGISRFWQLFNESHAVLAYGVDKTQQLVNIYDPNAPKDNFATIQLVPSSRPGGGIKVVHGDGSVSYGGGVQGTSDFGQPDEWTLMPLPEAAFSDSGIVSGQDNLHWVLDAGALALIHRLKSGKSVGGPLFKFIGATPADNTTTQLLSAGVGYSDTVTAEGSDSDTTVFAGSHGAQATQTDSGAAGSKHDVTVSPDARQMTLSGASTAEQYTLLLAGDFLSSGYGRRFTLSGATLAPNASLIAAVDPTYSALTLSTGAGSTEQSGLLLEQLGQTGGATSVTATVPGNGAQGIVYVGDWTGLSSSLIFEVITATDGTVTGLLLQDNAAQRQALVASLIGDAATAAGQISDQGIQNSLEVKLTNALNQSGANPDAAANMLSAVRNEIAAQNGKAIEPTLAASLDSTLREVIGLLRAGMR